MFDVVPPAPSSPRRSSFRPSLARPKSRQIARVPARMPMRPQDNRPQTISLDWRLPARLRRPIRQELDRQRRRQKARKAIIEFERRPIYSSLPNTYPAYRSPVKPPTNTGAEHHTGDVYMSSRPEIGFGVPPYQGRHSQAFLTPRNQRQIRPIKSPPPVARKPNLPKKPRLVSPDIQGRIIPPQRKLQLPARTVINKPAPRMTPQPARQTSSYAALPPKKIIHEDNNIAPNWPNPEPAPTAPLSTPEETFRQPEIAVKNTPPAVTKNARHFTLALPYQWPKRKKVPVALSVPIEQDDSEPSVPTSATKSSKRFALPLHFSILPANLLPSKKKLLNLSILALIGLVLMGGITGLQDAGHGYAAIGQITEKAQAALGHVASAETALAATKFDTSESEFAQAESLLQEAHSELTNALSASRVILEAVDVTGKVKSGEELLVAGEQLTQAGQHVSQGLTPLMKAKLFVKNGEKPQVTMVEAINYATTEFNAAITNLETADKSLSNVRISAVPPDLREKVMTLQDSVPKAKSALSIFVDQSHALLTLLGAERQRQYLVIFENNDEMRPTGGFIGSLALLNVDRGIVENINVQSSYDPDGQLKEMIAPPAPLNIVTDRWYMRDANWFVDYRVSAEKISNFFEKEGGPTVDGVIAMTPDVIKGLLKVTGPIEVPGYNVRVDENNFVVLTQDQVTYAYDKSKNKPKQFLADLTPILLNKLFASPSEASLQVLGTLGTMMSQKQLLVYFKDPELQSRIHDVGWDGSYPANAQGFLSVNNANIGGHKSDQFIAQEIDYRTMVKADGNAEATVTIRRTHHGPTEAINYPYPPGEDPSKKDNIIYQRVMVPLGSKLLEAKGFTPAADIKSLINPDPAIKVVPDSDVVDWQRLQQTDSTGTTIGQEAGYSYFANWVNTKPGETTVVVYRYTLPKPVDLPNAILPAKRYQVYIAKQPGDRRTTIRAEIQLPESEKIVHTVPTDGITYEGDNTAVYRGALQNDLAFGAVFTGQ